MIPQAAEDNLSLWRPGSRKGFYESYFLRGNCPAEPRAFWIKYTIFVPRGRPGEAEGELWAVYFEGLEGKKVPVKEAYPLRECLFAADRFEVRVGEAYLTDGTSTGRCASGSHEIRWELSFPTTGPPPLHLLPAWAYRSRVPKAKAKVPYPDITWAGFLIVNDERIDVTGWQGSQNHNWGQRHTDRYAWAQCNTYAGSPGTVAEMASARLRLGPVWSPYLSLLVLRHRGQEIRFDSLGSLARARARFPGPFTWELRLDNGTYQAHCSVAANKETFAGLRYRNPPGGELACLNSKIASSHITLLRQGKEVETLRSDFTTAFEILTHRTDHGVPLLV